MTGTKANNEKIGVRHTLIEELLSKKPEYQKSWIQCIIVNTENANTENNKKLSR